MNRKWYVVYTKANSEKKVLSQLRKKKIVHFFPLKTIKGIADDKKEIAAGLPLFNSLIFIKADETELQLTLKLDKVISILHWRSSPAIIPEQEIEDMKRFIMQYNRVSVIPAFVKQNQPTELTITKGDEKVTNHFFQRITLTLPSLGYMLITETAAQHVNLISTAQPKNLLANINTSAL